MEYNETNGMPLDGRIRPVYVHTGFGNKIVRTIVYSDGKGNAYNCDDNPYYRPEFTNENLIDPNIIKFERGLSGMEF